MTTRRAAFFTRQLSDLLAGGLPLSKSLEILNRQTKDGVLGETIRSLRFDLESGKSFSEAIKGQNGFSQTFYVGMIRAGESSGNLEEVMEELALLTESELDMRQKIRAAMIYPALLLAMSLAVCAFLTLFVIPRFEILFQDLGQDLPLPTRALLSTAAFFRQGAWLLIPLGAALVGWVYKTNQEWKERTTRFLWGRPLLAGFVQAAFLERWAQIMASLTKSGLPLTEALLLSAGPFPKAFFGREIDKVIVQIYEGKSLGEALKVSILFPPSVSEMVGAAEESGRLEQTLGKISQSFRRESEAKMKLALTLLEPALIFGMGIVVGFIALAMILPIYDMSGGLK